MLASTRRDTQAGASDRRDYRGLSAWNETTVASLTADAR